MAHDERSDEIQTIYRYRALVAEMLVVLKDITMLADYTVRGTFYGSEDNMERLKKAEAVIAKAEASK